MVLLRLKTNTWRGCVAMSQIANLVPLINEAAVYQMMIINSTLTTTVRESNVKCGDKMVPRSKVLETTLVGIYCDECHGA